MNNFCWKFPKVATYNFKLSLVKFWHLKTEIGVKMLMIFFFKARLWPKGDTDFKRKNSRKDGTSWLNTIVAVPHGSGSPSNGGLSATADPTNPEDGSWK